MGIRISPEGLYRATVLTNIVESETESLEDRLGESGAGPLGFARADVLGSSTFQVELMSFPSGAAIR